MLSLIINLIALRLNDELLHQRASLGILPPKGAPVLEFGFLVRSNPQTIKQ